MWPAVPPLAPTSQTILYDVMWSRLAAAPSSGAMRRAAPATVQCHVAARHTGAPPAAALPLWAVAVTGVAAPKDAPRRRRRVHPCGSLRMRLTRTRAAAAGGVCWHERDRQRDAERGAWGTKLRSAGTAWRLADTHGCMRGAHRRDTGDGRHRRAGGSVAVSVSQAEQRAGEGHTAAGGGAVG